MRNNLHGGVAEVAQHTWHQEPEQRPAGGSLGVCNRAMLDGRLVMVRDLST
jgi:hypothetical protein